MKTPLPDRLSAYQVVSDSCMETLVEPDEGVSSLDVETMSLRTLTEDDRIEDDAGEVDDHQIHDLDMHGKVIEGDECVVDHG